MGFYKAMVTEAREKGVANEKAMWSGINDVDELLESIKDVHSDVYWRFMRKAHASMYGPHYDCKFAENDVKNIRYTGRDGKEHQGAHWSWDEVMNAVKDMDFPKSATKGDIYVAMNATYADLCQDWDDDAILKIGHRFYFKDEDAPDGKVWKYMNKMQYGY